MELMTPVPIVPIGPPPTWPFAVNSTSEPPGPIAAKPKRAEVAPWNTPATSADSSMTSLPPMPLLRPTG
jgi:hypothetical protein